MYLQNQSVKIVVESTRRNYFMPRLEHDKWTPNIRWRRLPLQSLGCARASTILEQFAWQSNYIRGLVSNRRFVCSGIVQHSENVRLFGGNIKLYIFNIFRNVTKIMCQVPFWNNFMFKLYNSLNNSYTLK